MEGENKSCPRCGNFFKCNHFDIMNCSCIMVPLNMEARQEISAQYNDCLCNGCLKEYALRHTNEHEISN